MARKSCRGFSTIDILMVAAVGIIISGIAVPAIQRSIVNYRLATAADRLASELEAARLLSISRNTVYTVVFDTVANTFQIVDQADPENPTRMRRSLGEGVRFGRLPDQPITFHTRGLTQGGAVSLTSDGNISISIEVGSSGKTVVKSMATGAGTTE